MKTCLACLFGQCGKNINNKLIGGPISSMRQVMIVATWITYPFNLCDKLGKRKHDRCAPLVYVVNSICGNMLAYPVGQCGKQHLRKTWLAYPVGQ